MKYCKKCKQIKFTDDVNCSCGKKLIENVSLDAPCELLRTDETNSVKIDSVLAKSGVPYSDVMTNKVQMLFGSVTGDHIFYVPICFLKKSIDSLVAVNAMEQPDYYDKIDLPDEPQWEELSLVKRNIVRALSIIGFAVLVYLCVAGVDTVAYFIKGLFG